MLRTVLTPSQARTVLGGSRTRSEFIDSGALLPLESNLIHLWRFNSDYVDARGGVTLVPQSGTPVFEPALYNDGVRITPGNERLLATGLSAAIIDGGGSFSCAGWVKQNAADSHWYLLSTIRVSPSAGGWFLAHTASTSKHFFEVRDAFGGNVHAEEPTKITAVGDWIFQCGVWDNVLEQATYYYGIGGGALQTRVGVRTGWTGPRHPSTDAIRSGYFIVGDATQDHVKIWDLALTPTLVAALYAQGLAK